VTVLDNFHELEIRLAAGDRDLFGELFDRHRPRLWRFVHFRLDGRIRGRVDPDDVLQDVYLDGNARIDSYLAGDYPSLFLWLRLVAAQTLSNVHRAHLGVQSRSVLKERSLPNGVYLPDASVSLSFHFVDKLSTPSQKLSRNELIGKMHEVMESIRPADREIIALRHFEELTNQEVAAVLGIQAKAASIRYVRALERLQSAMSQFPDFKLP
jgi:RNA polymerase sigma-70 factor (ECF subfamily)